MCERSRLDPAFPRYPSLPVLACAGFEPNDANEPVKRDLAAPADLD
jgi:hypothetical protein